MEVLLLLAMGAMNITCLVIGVKIGQQVAKGEPVKVGIPNPVAVINEHRAEEKANRERNKMEIILHNIERYDGTPDGQEDVPQ